MESLAAYVPMDRRWAMVEGKELPDRTHGAVLFADISGFTPLTEAVVGALGLRRGAEELTHQLNQVYGVLIDEVHRYHGSVVNFSGDAITCWFNGDNGQRAAGCALALQQVMTQFEALPTPAGSTIQLAIKVAVTSGPARRFLVGVPDIQSIDVLAGAILDRVAAAEQQLRQGEVIVGAEVLAGFGDQAQIGEWRADPSGEKFAVLTDLAEPVPPAAWPEVPSPGPEVARCWILPPVAERLERGEGEFLAELRPAVPLFLKFSGIDYDQDDEAGAKLDRYVRWVQSVLARYDGYLLQMTMGDKGSYLYASFGAPVAHEDDAARAVAPELDLADLPSEISYIGDVRIGISQGRMRAGAYGGPTRRAYGVLGNEVNTAARLMDRAERGQILATEEITRAARGYDYQDLGQVRLKGHAQAQTLFAVRGRRARQAETRLEPHTQAPLVGRGPEQAVLGERLQNLLAGRGGSVVIEGEAGIGKSRLVTDLMEQAQALDVPTVLGAGDAVEQTTAYFAWRPVFSDLFGLGGAADAEVAREQVLARLEDSPSLLERAPLLSAVLPIPIPDNELTAQMRGGVRADNTRDLLVQVLDRAQRAGSLSLVVLEDGHWLDPSSWALALTVGQRLSGTLLVVTTRPLGHSVPSEYQGLLTDLDSLHLKLNALPAEDTLALVRQRLDVDQLPPEVADLIRGKSAGNPFFSEQLAYALRDAGVILIQEGAVRVAPHVANLREVSVPNTVESVVTSRIDRLPPAQQLTLKVASVIGNVFAYRPLHDVHPVEADRAHLSDYLESAERRNITQLERPEPDLTYVFRHAITHEVVYNMLLFSQRRGLHRAVAEWYEGHLAGELDAYYPLLAHHWGNAEDPEKTMVYLEQAGAQARRQGVYREAIGFYTQLLDLNEVQQVITDPARLARWQHGLGASYLSVGDFDESFGHLTKALELLDRPLPPSQAGLMAGLLGQVARQFLHRRWPKRFLGRSKDPGDVLVVSRVYEHLVQIFYHRNESAGVLYTVLQQLNRAEEAPPSPQLARAYASMSVAAGIAALHKLGKEYVRLANEALPAATQLTDQGLVNEYIGMYRSTLGQWDEAQSLLEDAISKMERIGNRRRWLENLSLLAIMLLPRGKVKRSAELRAQLHTAAVQYGDVQIEGWALLEQAEIALLEGELDGAFGFLNRAGELSAKFGRTEVIWYNGLLGVAHLRGGKPTQAREAAGKAQKVISESPPNAYYLLEAYAGVAEVSVTLWDPAAPASDDTTKAAQKAARQAVKSLKKFARSFPIGAPRALLWEGAYEHKAGKPVVAQTAWEQALKEAQRLAMPNEQALAHYRLGHLVEGDDAARADHIQRAGEIWTELGAAYQPERPERP
jgi:class 3 adenylate cyclase/tetratricopeptide (TPR) repeat protein